jgi:hypothetical protein
LIVNKIQAKSSIKLESIRQEELVGGYVLWSIRTVPEIAMWLASEKYRLDAGTSYDLQTTYT